MSEISDLLWEISDTLWFIPFVLIIALGLFATFALKGVQFRKVKEMIKVTFNRKKGEGQKLSSFEVFWISMGNRIGVGNITGPVLAVLTGGPGAIFWMWVFATLGGATIVIETTVGQIFKSKNREGGYNGGPAYNISKGLNMKKFAVAIALIMIAMYFIGFVSSEVCSITESICGAVDFENNHLVVAIGMTIITGLIILGGIRRIADASTIIVPFMAAGWIIICIASIVISGGFFNGISMIFQYAFSIPAVLGGTLGTILVNGMRRGIWSNEAGLGTISNVSSSADVKHPVQQGLSQSIGILIDTIVSTISALVVLSYGNFDEIFALSEICGDSMPTLQAVFNSTLGDFAPMLIAIFIFLFAITCLMGDYVIGNNNLTFITDNKMAKYGLIVVILAVVFLSCFYASDELYAVMDILFAIVGTISCLVMFKMRKHAVEAFRDYWKQKSEGIEEPVFHKSTLSDPSGVTEWDD